MQAGYADADKALQQAFQNFAMSVHLLRDHIARENTESHGMSLFGPLALETLSLWTHRIKQSPLPKRDAFHIAQASSDESNRTRHAWELENVVAIGVDSFTAILQVDKGAASNKLLRAGVVPAVVHALQASSSPHVRIAADYDNEK